MKIYLVVRYDRHFDNEYSTHRDLDTAKDNADKFMRWYIDNGHGYEWKEEEISGWIYFHSTHDDGPRVHIEELELK